jgi:tetratricopeptide (TPR) repeat protein
MAADLRGYTVTGADAATLAGLHRFEADFHAFRDEAAAILDVAAAAPDCAVAQIHAAALHVYSQSAGQIALHAAPLLNRARQAARHATPRERALLGAVDAWARSDFADAARRFEALAAEWPRDVTAAKFAEFVFFEWPDFPRHLRFMDSIAATNDDLPCFKAMHAFAYELNGHYGRAEAIAEDALAEDPHTPWAHHALAHLYLNTGRIEGGITALDRAAPLWAAHGQGIRTHNSWHLALLHLSALDLDEAMRLYHTEIAGPLPDSVFEHTDALSLLWRFELAGAGVPPALWQAYAPQARRLATDVTVPFLAALYVHALARAGEADAAAAAIDRIAADKAEGGHGWTVGITLMKGVLALASGRHRAGVALLEPILGAVGCTGGSDAQNDIFAQAYIAGLVASGRGPSAAAMMRSRIGDRRPTPLEDLWLSRC